MDYPLGEMCKSFKWICHKCLNPYSNGLPSRGQFAVSHSHIEEMVLIPILMDYPLGDQERDFAILEESGLNPYSNGLPSRGFIRLSKFKIKKICLNPYSNGLPSRGPSNIRRNT